jgi:NAD(P)-dependent dehydrogenase (short-subunit alcohol dehydrogenase family)
MSTPVLLILGAGPRIGSSVTSSFAAKGYKIALAARSLDDGLGSDGCLRLRVDLSHPEEIEGVFEKVKEQLGIPTVVLYNGRSSSISRFPRLPVMTILVASYRVLRDVEDPLSSISIDEVNGEFAINVISPLFAVKQAVNGFRQLPNSASKTFIYTGNILNLVVKSDVLTYGMTKVAAANMIQTTAVAYAKEAFK